MSSYLLPFLIERAALSPEGIAIDTPSEKLTYVEWLQLIEQRSQRFREQMSLLGRRIAFQIKPSISSLTTFIAFESLGAEILLLSPKITDLELKVILMKFKADYWADGETPLMPVERPVERKDSVIPIQRRKAETFAMVTSGTTGVPKLVNREWKAVVENARAFSMIAGYSPKDRVLCTTPLHHSYAFSTAFMSCLVSGATLLLTHEAGRPTHAVAHAGQRQATVIQSVPFVYQNAPHGEGYEGIRLLISAGERLQPELVAEWKSRCGRGLSNHYGTTELGMLTLSQEGDTESIGRPLPGVHMREHNSEIQVQAGSGWVGTGDRGTILKDGRVALEGRLIPLLNIAGNKVDPIEIEQTLLKLPSVQECVVLGRPTASGEAIEAVVVPRSSFAEDEARRFLATQLSAYKVPKTFKLVEKIPRTESGKLQRGMI